MTLDQKQKTVWSENESPSIKTYTLSNFRELPQIQKISEEKKFEMEVVSNVLPFKTNNYVVEQLIDWNDIPNDPMFVLTFPQKEMLIPKHYQEMETALKKGSDKKQIQEVANNIRLQLNPHPAGQMELNVPTLKRWNQTLWNATQVQRNMSVLPKSESNMSCILQFLL